MKLTARDQQFLKECRIDRTAAAAESPLWLLCLLTVALVAAITLLVLLAAHLAGAPTLWVRP